LVKYDMLTPAQCRAARAFLNWTLADLAAASGLSRASLNAFEGEKGNPKAETLARVRYALEQKNIEFTDEPGVRIKRELVRILRGPQCHRELMDDIYETLRAGGGEVLLNNVDERKGFETHRDELLAFLDKAKAANITERLLVCEGDTFFLLPAECYRWVPQAAFQAGVMNCVYGDKCATKVWGEDIIILVQNAAVAAAERARFEHLWTRAEIPVIK